MRGLVLLLVFLAGHLPADETSPTRLSGLLGAGEDSAFAVADVPREFRFPEDHGPHPAFRNEWWYVTGNLDADRGRRFGFELTIFRFALTPGVPATRNDWQSDQVYIAHFAITDPAGDQFLAAEKSSRGAAGLAGATPAPGRVWIDDWQLRYDGDRWLLEASTGSFGISLLLESLKPPVLNGNAGLSQKSAEPGNASYYYSMTRLATSGIVVIGDQTFDVTGESWLDREWSTSALGARQVGWDWFALQLEDGSELMFYQLRLDDGSPDPESAGTLTAPDGSYEHLSAGEVALSVTGSWDSPAGGTYPSGWRIEIPGKGLFLDVDPIMADQELFTIVRYWEGAVDVAGTRDGQPVGGRGYVELTGYAEDE